MHVEEEGSHSREFTNRMKIMPTDACGVGLGDILTVKTHTKIE